MRHLTKAVALGVLVAMLGLAVGLSPLGLDLEEGLGLQLLFSLRGARPAPPDVVVVSIDRASADALGLPSDAAKWPRSVHARLLEALTRAQARVIVFDVFFQEPGRVPEDDARFAEAMHRSGNVVLATYLSRETVPLAAADSPPGLQANIERLVPPLGLFADAAVGTAPFLLPKVPVRVSQFWTFKRGAGDVATLPVVALHVFARQAQADLVALLARSAPAAAAELPSDSDQLIASGHVERVVATTREVVHGRGLALAPPPSAAAAGTEPGDRLRMLRALAGMYRAPDSLYLDFYGPARTIATVPYHELIGPAGARVDLRGKAVFIGVSGRLRLEQKDDFHTVFSDASGVDLSGVEIAATAFANLLESRHVRPLGTTALAAVLLIGGLLLGAVCRGLPPLLALVVTIAAAAGYLAVAHQRFAAAGTWLPLVVPLLVQAPAAIGAGVLWHYVDTNRERQATRRAFSYYLPDAVIDRLVANRSAIGASNQLVYGICLYTDAGRYTALAESLAPDALADLMNRYYATVFEPVRRRGGTISDIVGDSALAVWASPGADPALRASACEAACDIRTAVERFNAANPAARLPTRIGLHAGEMALANVGAMDHYEYRAVGDIVNTATRLEGLNKHLGTAVLVSEDVLAGLDGFLTRRLGAFLLVGKSKPVVVHELLGPRSVASPDDVARCADFGRALAAYQAGAWREAVDAFAALVRARGDDGPCRFYLRVCAGYLEHPPGAAWEPVLRMEAK